MLGVMVEDLGTVLSLTTNFLGDLRQDAYLSVYLNSSLMKRETSLPDKCTIRIKLIHTQILQRRGGYICR